jgi:hypothetical protein
MIFLAPARRRRDGSIADTAAADHSDGVGGDDRAGVDSGADAGHGIATQ